MADEPITIELNPSERRLYDRVRAQVAKGHPGAGADFRDLLLLLPDLTVLLLRLLRDERVPLGGKLAALVGVGYVLSPIDLLPELLLGPIDNQHRFDVRTDRQPSPETKPLQRRQSSRHSAYPLPFNEEAVVELCYREHVEA